MIRIFNSAFNNGERFLELDEVTIVSQKINYMGRPYILFEHKDYPMGALRAEYDGEVWSCDLD
jgi:hypothetical protein